MQTAYPALVAQAYDEGTKLLQAPVGAYAYVASRVMETVDEANIIMEKVASLGDMQVSLALLKSCASSCLLMYLLRLVEPRLSLPAAERFDINVV